MTMIPTATGYRLAARPPGSLRPRPAHRAVMTAEQARICLETKAYQRPQPEHGAHYVATFEPADLRDEYLARLASTTNSGS